MAQQQVQTTVVVAPGQPVVQTSVVVHKKQGNSCRAAIPAMHIAMAIVCLILNILIPGLGTILAGFSVFCCANPGQSGGEKFGTMCLNFWVGLLQLATTTLFFIGWIWSIVWGVAFIAMSNDYHQTNKTTTTLVTNTTPGQQAMVITQTQQPQQPPQPYSQPPPQGYNMPPQGYHQPPPPQGYNPAAPPVYNQPPQGYNAPPPQPNESQQQAYQQQPPYTPYDQQKPQQGQQAPPPYNPDHAYPQKS